MHVLLVFMAYPSSVTLGYAIVKQLILLSFFLFRHERSAKPERQCSQRVPLYFFLE
jgi:hypothetical protein